MMITTSPTTQNIVELLQNPRALPNRPSHVETIETHISWVFLTDHRVYKLKKPVRFEFLDFSSPQARRLACEEEVRLNRRLAHKVYLSVLPVTVDQRHRLELDGDGTEIDYVVEMRRLPADRALDHLICRRQLHTSDMKSLTRYLVEFYTRLPPKVLQPRGHHRHLVEHCQSNLNDLLGLLGERYELEIRRIHTSQMRYLTLEQGMFYDRVCDGRIVDGHGDLRAEHIFLESPPAVIDCVEFSKEFREVDVIDELAFLAMDCQRLGNSDVGRHVLEAFQNESGDHPPEELVAFYKSYRACVRAKVAALQLEQAQDVDKKPFLRQVHQYLTWADYYAAQLGRPALVIIGGMMGSGKSTLAREVAESIGAELIHTDGLRLSLLGSSEIPARYGEGIYSSDLRQRVYDELLARAEVVLNEGRSVVLDGTFLTNDLRWAALKRGKQHGACSLFAECECPREVALSRINQRTRSEAADSEARPDLFEQQRSEREAIDPAIPVIRINSTTSINQELQVVCSALRAALFGG